jgi:hypothetical protein
MVVKRAVVVGINDYTAQWPSGNANLTWCVNDARSFYHLLVEAFGFDPAQVYFYTDQAASRDNILRALRTITTRGEPGDVACFYYSGHGARVPARGGPGDVDAFYETIVPASGSWISDWEIAQIANDLQPHFVNFTVFLDSCHSGGMHPTDAANKVRSPQFSDQLVSAMLTGAALTLIPMGLGLPAAVALQVFRGNVRNPRRSANGSNGMVDLDPDPDKTLIEQSKSTLISACNYNELSWEASSLQHGLMTRSIIDLVSRQPYVITHHDLMEELRTRVGAYITQHITPGNPGVRQTPQLRGQANRMTEDFLEGWRDCR